MFKNSKTFKIEDLDPKFLISLSTLVIEKYEKNKNFFDIIKDKGKLLNKLDSLFIKKFIGDYLEDFKNIGIDYMKIILNENDVIKRQYNTKLIILFSFYNFFKNNKNIMKLKKYVQLVKEGIKNQTFTSQIDMFFKKSNEKLKDQENIEIYFNLLLELIESQIYNFIAFKMDVKNGDKLYSNLRNILEYKKLEKEEISKIIKALNERGPHSKLSAYRCLVFPKVKFIELSFSSLLKTIKVIKENPFKYEIFKSRMIIKLCQLHNLERLTFYKKHYHVFFDDFLFIYSFFNLISKDCHDEKIFNWICNFIDRN
ncbi:hypothetical protein HERIO_1102 [Hepatospora eriocheir]|uniref:Uncharacterized protein n=1 Tax=Hepatospora eriocheir TaxID=1081669 RepID=A0A1X0QB46_9MICR|nr:hypothetical protein HERIO_1102 [Hepatospora eriocheir]